MNDEVEKARREMEGARIEMLKEFDNLLQVTRDYKDVMVAYGESAERLNKTMKIALEIGKTHPSETLRGDSSLQGEDGTQVAISKKGFLYKLMRDL